MMKHVIILVILLVISFQVMKNTREGYFLEPSLLKLCHSA